MNNFQIGQLRHLYHILVTGEFTDAKKLAEELLHPAIAALERDVEGYESTIQHLKAEIAKLEVEVDDQTEIIEVLQSSEG